VDLGIATFINVRRVISEMGDAAWPPLTQCPHGTHTASRQRNISVSIWSDSILPFLNIFCETRWDSLYKESARREALGTSGRWTRSRDGVWRRTKADILYIEASRRHAASGFGFWQPLAEKLAEENSFHMRPRRPTARCSNLIRKTGWALRCHFHYF
jgi:hypothetical protein